MKHAPTTQRSICVCLISFAVLLCVLWPLGVVLANAVALTVWVLLQVLYSPVGHAVKSQRDMPKLPRAIAAENSYRNHFVSVHLPIHNEPADVVKATLNALARLSYNAVEIIVIDNNTNDAGLWRPVERHCQALGSRFRFVHRDGVVGAKAGALEIARKIMDERTTHIAVVDADYQVSADFLHLALGALEQSGAHFAQFPQAYRNVSDQQQSVEAELDDYFQRHAVAADRRGHMLLTGTLSVIDAAALEAAGGWPRQTITEDAELAMSLRRAGFKGVFVPHIAGRGLLPPNLHELQSQRHRWIVGNLQTLLRALAQSICDRRALVSAGHLAQLSAWCSFITIPVVLIMAGVFLSALEWSDPAAWHPIALIASATIIGQLLVTFWLSRGTHGFWAVRWTLALSSGMATLSGLTMQRMRFRCTRRSSESMARVSIHQIVTSMLFFTAALCALSLSWFMATTALLLCAFSRVSLYSLDRVLRTSSPTQYMDQHQGVSSSHGK